MPTDKELASYISEWFSRKRVPAARRQSPVWKAIRAALAVTGNFKNAPRGNPRAGGKKTMAILAARKPAKVLPENADGW
jgi:hypothetical protein